MTDRELIIEVCEALARSAMKLDQSELDMSKEAQEYRDKAAAIRRLLEDPHEGCVTRTAYEMRAASYEALLAKYNHALAEIEELKERPSQSHMETQHERWVLATLNWLVTQGIPMGTQTIPEMLLLLEKKNQETQRHYQGISAALVEAQKENERNYGKWWDLEQNYVLPVFRWGREMEPKIELEQLVASNPGKNCIELFFAALRDRLTAAELNADACTTACGPAFDEIAKLCGPPTWDYPGQVIRDVRRLVEEKEQFRLGAISLNEKWQRAIDDKMPLRDEILALEKEKKRLLLVGHAASYYINTRKGLSALADAVRDREAGTDLAEGYHELARRVDQQADRLGALQADIKDLTADRDAWKAESMRARAAEHLLVKRCLELKDCVIYARDRRATTFDYDEWIAMVELALKEP